jgi:hypothetical protein
MMRQERRMRRRRRKRRRRLVGTPRNWSNKRPELGIGQISAESPILGLLRDLPASETSIQKLY